MQRLAKTLFAVVLSLTAVWLAAHLWLDVQLPDAPAGRGAFPDPMPADLVLAGAFEQLPSGGGENSRLRLLQENAEAWTERWRLLETARSRIDVSYFILKPDVFGMAFLGHLIERARDGVQIRILLDAMGTEMSREVRGNDYLDTLVNIPNIEVRMYRPLRYRYLDAFLTLNPAAVLASDHDKMLLVDGRQALVGGRNISAEYFTPLPDDPEAFHDTDVALSGAVIGRTLTEAFEAHYDSGEAHPVVRGAINLPGSERDLLLAYHAMQVWLTGQPYPEALRAAIRQHQLSWIDELDAVRSLRGALATARPPQWPALVRLLDSRTRLVAVDDPISRSLIRLVRSAREEIFIQSPYLVLLDDAAEVLAEAAARGVRITVFTNGPLSSDNPLSQAIFLEQWPRLLARIPDLRLYVAGDRHNLHSKVAVLDRRLALIGTYNLDPLSMTMNSELMVAAWSRTFAEQVLAKPERLIAAGSPRVFRYRLCRTADGEPCRDSDGAPLAAFGAEDHTTPEQRQAIRRYRGWVRRLAKLPFDTPLL